MNIFIRYIVIKNAFSREKVEEWTENVWIRLGMDPSDKSTWTNEKVHMPWHRREPVETFAPRVRQTNYLSLMIR